MRKNYKTVHAFDPGVPSWLLGRGPQSRLLPHAVEVLAYHHQPRGWVVSSNEWQRDVSGFSWRSRTLTTGPADRCAWTALMQRRAPERLLVYDPLATKEAQTGVTKLGHLGVGSDFHSIDHITTDYYAGMTYALCRRDGCVKGASLVRRKSVDANNLGCGPEKDRVCARGLNIPYCLPRR